MKTSRLLDRVREESWNTFQREEVSILDDLWSVIVDEAIAKCRNVWDGSGQDENRGPHPPLAALTSNDLAGSAGRFRKIGCFGHGGYFSSCLPPRSRRNECPWCGHYLSIRRLAL